MFVLAIDTSSPAVKAGIVALDGVPRLVAARAPIAPRGHGELLSPAIAECLDEADLAPGDLGAVVAGTGPGPYTGLRVGLVTAAAFADACGVPAYGVCSLDAIEARDAVVVTDARRHEVYWARYADGARVDGPRVDRPGDVPLEGVTAIAGAAVELYDWPAQLTQLPERHPDPVRLVALAADRIRARQQGEPLMPLYLRHPDATVPAAPKRASQ